MKRLAQSPRTYLALLLLSMVGIIEWKYHYYFLKTDNLDQNLPYYVHNLNALLAGEFPLFNFHQYLGTPVFACIQSAALYLPNYGALLLSKALFGHYFATIELLAACHLVLAAIGFFQLMRQWGLGVVSSFFGGLTWALSGFVMRVGDGWVQVIEYAAYFPWILLYGQQLAGKFALRPFVILTLLRTAAFWVGYPPFFIYIATFEFLFSAGNWLVDGSGNDGGTTVPSRLRRLLRLLVQYVAGYGAVAFLSAPLLLSALHQISLSADRSSPLSWERYSQAGYTFIWWLKSLLLLPFTAEQSRLAGDILYVAYVGWPTVIFALASVFCHRPYRKLAAVALSLGVLALLWADNTFVTRLVYYFPFFNRQRFPFKLLFFTSFFTIVLAALGYERLLVEVGKRWRRTAAISAIVLLVQAVNLLVFHLYGSYGPSRQVKQIPYAEPLQRLLDDSRIVTIVARDTDEADKHPYLLGYDYATLFGLYHFAGYETLVSQRNLDMALQRNSAADFYVDNDFFDPSPADLDYFRRWGVRWYVLDNRVKFAAHSELQPVYRDTHRFVLYDEAARPPASWADTARDEGVNHWLTTNSFRIATERNSDGQLVVNELYNPFFTAFIDNERVPLAETADSQIQLQVPAGRHLIRIVYRDPYFVAGLFLTGGFLIGTAVWLIVVLHRRRRMTVCY